ncbi:hypothetical protein BS17DRAFT_818134 [Gyrodon lividus]|nr:hypothetical protein BS17DRAFT_818134 [Gyrodon lividus]
MSSDSHLISFLRDIDPGIHDDCERNVCIKACLHNHNSSQGRGQLPIVIRIQAAKQTTKLKKSFLINLVSSGALLQLRIISHDKKKKAPENQDLFPVPRRRLFRIPPALLQAQTVALAVSERGLPSILDPSYPDSNRNLTSYSPSAATILMASTRPKRIKRSFFPLLQPVDQSLSHMDDLATEDQGPELAANSPRR